MSFSLLTIFFRTYRLTVGVTELFLWYGRQLKFSTPNRLRNSADNGGRTHVTSRATVVCATMHANHSIIDAISSWCQNDPAEVVIVAAPQAYPRLRDMTEAWSFSVPVRIIKAPVTNKRHQLCIGGQQAPTDYLVITDDDMRWEANVVENLVEALDTDSSLGCVFPDIDNEPVGKSMTFWERLTSIKHTGEVVDFHCSLSVDGGIVYHYGGTVAYRSHILQDERFIADFTGETWRRQVLNSGDDQFLCRWMVNEGWSIARRKAYGCIARARSRNDWRHLLQVIRWSRNDWRASLSTLIWERTIWRYVHVDIANDHRC